MNLVKELENVLNQPHFMGMIGNPGVNLAVNAILDKIEELGFDILERKKKEDITKPYPKELIEILQVQNLMSIKGNKLTMDFTEQDDIFKLFGTDENNITYILSETNIAEKNIPKVEFREINQLVKGKKLTMDLIKDNETFKLLGIDEYDNTYVLWELKSYKLNFYKNTIINVKTQLEFNKLMDIYGSLELNSLINEVWERYCENTCCFVGEYSTISEIGLQKLDLTSKDGYVKYHANYTDFKKVFVKFSDIPNEYL